MRVGMSAAAARGWTSARRAAAAWVRALAHGGDGVEDLEISEEMTLQSSGRFMTPFPERCGTYREQRTVSRGKEAVGVRN
jgi:hypothetical protein